MTSQPHTRRRAALLGLCGVAWACAAPAGAAGWSTFVVDDSMTHVQPGGGALRWRSPRPPKNAPDMLSTNVNVDVVLNVLPWVGKLARIYMVMPALPQSTLRIEWVSKGLLLPGQLSGGQRQLVFQGVIPTPRIEELLRVTALADARDPVTPQRVNFTFEIEVQNR